MTQKHFIKIVGGKWRGRKLFLPAETESLRPSLARHRESVFNMLCQGRYGNLITGARVLDACCGTGALGIEALSRGADSVCFVDQNPASLHSLSENLNQLFETTPPPYIALCRGDILGQEFPSGSFDLIFADPPYESDLAQRLLLCCAQKNWLDAQGVLLLETQARKALQTPETLELSEQRVMGKSCFWFWQRKAI